jgi:hypothetical protein
MISALTMVRDPMYGMIKGNDISIFMEGACCDLHRAYTSSLCRKAINAVEPTGLFTPIQLKYPNKWHWAELLGKVSGKEDLQLFLCNSGAEANENALKLASFL